MKGFQLTSDHRRASYATIVNMRTRPKIHRSSRCSPQHKNSPHVLSGGPCAILRNPPWIVQKETCAKSRLCPGLACNNLSIPEKIRMIRE